MLMEAKNPTTPCIALQVPTQPRPLSDMLRPVATNKATAFFAEHMQIEEGLKLARTQKPHTRILPQPHMLPTPVKPKDNACDTLMTTWTKAATPSRTEAIKHSSMIKYNQKYRGLNSAKSAPMNGKYPIYKSFVRVYKAFWDTVTTPTEVPPLWKASLPTRSSLHSIKRFGRPKKDHSNTQKAAFETCLFPILTSGFLDFYSFCCLYSTHILVIHLVTMIIKCHSYDFTWIAYEDPFWKRQTSIPQSHAFAMLAALFHYKMHAPAVMQFLGGTYTGKHRDITSIDDFTGSVFSEF